MQGSRASKNTGAALDTLLGSRVRAALLKTFFTHPSETFYARELSRLTGFALAPIQRELARLLKLGILQSAPRGREILFRANDRYPLFPELKSIIYKTAGLGDILRASLGSFEGIHAALIYGSVAKGKESEMSDIDLLIVGQPNQTKLASAIRQVESQLKREVNLTLVGPSEWTRRRKSGEGFIMDLLSSPKIFLIGNERSIR